ncbi:MAG TPA: hypothetical protein VN259_00845, partial [Xanthomonadales bacterium]|nr:hypothetical protein [Xanthomonadales bacterium]
PGGRHHLRRTGNVKWMSSLFSLHKSIVEVQPGASEKHLRIGLSMESGRFMTLDQPKFGKLCCAPHSLLNVDDFDMCSAGVHVAPAAALAAANCT